MDVPTGATDPARTDRRRPARVLLAAAVLGALAAAAWWWTHPQAFDAYGGRGRTEVAVGRTANLNLLVPSRDVDVTVRSIRADVVQDSADADVELVLCGPVDGAFTGDSVGPLGPAQCSSVRPATEATDVDWGREALVVRVTPRRQGTVRIAGALVRHTRDWRHAWQTGTERTGTELVVSAR